MSISQQVYSFHYRYCGTLVPEALYSKQNVITIRFKTNENEVRDGFNLVFRRILTQPKPIPKKIVPTTTTTTTTTIAPQMGKLFL